MVAGDLNCPVCDALISVSKEHKFLTCPYCRSDLAVSSINGNRYLRLIDKKTGQLREPLPAIRALVAQDSADSPAELSIPPDKAVTALLPGAKESPIDIQKRQLRQQIAALEMELANIQAKISNQEHRPLKSQNKKELDSLRVQEYHALDQLRVLSKTLSDLDPQDTYGKINQMEEEIRWVNSEIQTLSLVSEDGDAWDLAADKLREYRHTLQIHISDLRIETIESQLESCKVKEIPAHDPHALEVLLRTMQADKSHLENLPQTLEVSIVKDRLDKRHQLVKQALVRLEDDDISAHLKSLQFPEDAYQFIPFNERLALVEEDLAFLDDQPEDNEVIQNYRNALLQEKWKLAAFLSKDENLLIPVSANADAAALPSPAITKKTAKTKTARKAKANSHQIYEIKSSDLGMGFLACILILIIFYIIGLFVTETLLSDLIFSNPMVKEGIQILMISIGLGLGVFLFMKMVAPWLKVRKSPQPNLDLGTIRKTGVTNPVAIRFLASLFTFLLTILFFLSAFFILDVDMLFFVPIALVGGLFVGLLTMSLTDIEPPDQLQAS